MNILYENSILKSLTRFVYKNVDKNNIISYNGNR